jgi:integrase
MKKVTSKRVTVGNISITVLPWTHRSGQTYWRFAWTCPHTSKRMFGTRSDQAEANKAAYEKALELSRAEFDPASLTDSQVKAIRKLLEHDPSLSFVDDYLASMARNRPKVALADSLTAFLAIKETNRAASFQNIKSLKHHLEAMRDHFGEKAIMAEITTTALQAFIDGSGKWSARYRLNIRRSVVTFFRWARKVGHLMDETTAAEKTEMPMIVRGTPGTYTVDQVTTIMASAAQEHVAWFALAALAGIRGDEMLPLFGGSKSPLDWSDILWDQGLIVVRPETAKTKHKRVVPLGPALRSWLEPLKKVDGPIVTKDPRRSRDMEHRGETTRLGALVGGWKPNALRHSFISYRAAQVGLGKTAMEAGNSESEAKRSYNDAMSEAEAIKYFAISRPVHENP